MNPTEFNQSIIELRPILDKYAKRLIDYTYTAKDLVQETYLKALINRKSYVGKSDKKLLSWLFTIMKNTFINDYRRRIMFSTEELIDILTIDPSVTSGIAYQELQVLILHLSPIRREAFQMYIDGYNYIEISVKLCISVGTVKSRIYYARQSLIKQIIKQDEKKQRSPN